MPESQNTELRSKRKDENQEIFVAAKLIGISYKGSYIITVALPYQMNFNQTIVSSLAILMQAVIIRIA